MLTPINDAKVLIEAVLSCVVLGVCVRNDSQLPPQQTVGQNQSNLVRAIFLLADVDSMRRPQSGIDVSSMTPWILLLKSVAYVANTTS